MVSIETLQASVGVGLQTPVGLAGDLNGNLLVTDLGANDIVRLLSTQTVQPPVSDPIIGVIFTNANITGFCLNAITNQTYNNDVIVAIQSEAGAQTFYTMGDSTDPAGIPNPGPTNSVPPEYFSCQSENPRSLLNPLRPDVTIKAISFQQDRRPSKIVTARIRFQVANPNILGKNPASFAMDTSTLGAKLWYTTNGSVPAIGRAGSFLYTPGAKLNVLNGTNDVIFKVKGFKDNYSDSAVVQQTFLFADSAKTHIGFAGDSMGANGATLVLPLDLALANGDTIQSLQFRVEVQANGGAPPLRALCACCR